MKSISDFIRDNATPLAAKVRERMKPLHDPESDELHPSIQWLLRKPKGPQGHLITGAVKALARQKDVVWGLAMGCGKTYAAIATAHCHANNQPYACLVVCPPHLVQKWEREIRATVKNCVVIQVEDWRQWMMLAKADKSLVKKATYFVTPMSKLKLGADWRAAVLKNKCSGLLVCPQCSEPVTEREGKYAKMEWVEAKQRFCRKCNGALWQNCGAHKIAPCKIIKKWMSKRKFFSHAIIDEAHTSKSETSLAGEAMADIIGCSEKIQILTGTLIAGQADDLRPTFFRLYPERFLKNGYKWADKGAFSEKYGKIETAIIEKQSHGSKEYGKAKATKKIRPGIMPNLYGDFVADRTLFLSLKEMGVALPEYKDETCPVDMPEELKLAYMEMAKVLIDKFHELCKGELPYLGLRFLPIISEALLSYPDCPSGWGSIGYKDEDGNLIPVYQPKDIHIPLLPKEKRLIDMLNDNVDRGEQSWVYVTRNATAARLKDKLRMFDVGHLTTAVSTGKREAWIRKEGPRVQVMISHPELVSTGYDLFAETEHGSYNFNNLIHY